MSEPILRTALSGMLAAMRRTEAAASNTANAGSLSRLVPKEGDAPAFQPLLVSQSAQTGGGVKVEFRPVDPATLAAPAGNSPLADENGLVGLPNIDLGQQRVDALSAQRAFEASLKVVQAADEMQDTALDIKS
jgi:flagellar basal-body rod protein FlgC